MYLNTEREYKSQHALSRLRKNSSATQRGLSCQLGSVVHGDVAQRLLLTTLDALHLKASTGYGVQSGYGDIKMNNASCLC